ncbi:unnamed protein product [Rhizoctonia solani]|uniref:PAS domain-containing protein n=1 Tax=Rhizoctonia solani TaxID=456999 RepID=A0A8H2XIA7_9AGAM|nr:unnamed protein product [Rhizoctonia solani]
MGSFIFMLRPSTWRFVYVSGSVTDVLGFEEQQILQFKMTDLLPDEEQEPVDNVLSAAIRENKAAISVYAQLLHSIRGVFVVCQMSISVAGNVIVGSISQASLDTIGNTVRDQSAEEVIVAATELTDHPGMMGYPALNWTGTQFARTVLLLDRFSTDCPITHCTNNAILDNETCVYQGFFRYVAPQDEASVRSFIASLRRAGLEANGSTNGFVYHTFTLCVAGRDLRAS